jgi:hypothetical protein
MPIHRLVKTEPSEEAILAFLMATELPLQAHVPPPQAPPQAPPQTARPARVKAFVCVQAQCNEAFTTEARMRRHVREAHHGGRFRCVHFDECGRDYSNASALSQHMFIIHGESRVQCPARRCTRVFHTVSALIRHGARFHPELPADLFSSTVPTQVKPTQSRDAASAADCAPPARATAGTAVSLQALDRRAWADAEVLAAALEQQDRAAPRAVFRCPWPGCAVRLPRRIYVRQHYIATHRPALAELKVLVREHTAATPLDAAAFTWTPSLSQAVNGCWGARVVPLPVSRGALGADGSVGVARTTKDWPAASDASTGAAPLTAEMLVVHSLLHAPVSLPAGPLRLSTLASDSLFHAPRVLDRATPPHDPLLRKQTPTCAFQPLRPLACDEALDIPDSPLHEALPPVIETVFRRPKMPQVKKRPPPLATLHQPTPQPQQEQETVTPESAISVLERFLNNT